MTEAEFQAQVIELATLYGWLPGHHHDSRRQVRPGVFVGDKLAAGIPDLILVRERAIWAELKTAKGKLRPEQVTWLDALAKAGAEIYLWRPSDLEEIQRILSRRWRYLPRGNRATQAGRESGQPVLVDSEDFCMNSIPREIRPFVPASLWVGDRRADAMGVAA
jgi:hypothetical protein